jgi:hypothetical protein
MDFEDVMILALTHGDGRDGDSTLVELVERLAAAGARVAGVVQDVAPAPRLPDGRKPPMTMRFLGEDVAHVISEDLGPYAESCRLNAGALETIAGALEARLATASPPPALVVVPKFSKREAEGAGFRNAMAVAAERGLPVLTTVKLDLVEDFRAYVADLGAVTDDADAAFAWGLVAAGVDTVA